MKGTADPLRGLRNPPPPLPLSVVHQAASAADNARMVVERQQEALQQLDGLQELLQDLQASAERAATDGGAADGGSSEALKERLAEELRPLVASVQELRSEMARVQTLAAEPAAASQGQAEAPEGDKKGKEQQEAEETISTNGVRGSDAPSDVAEKANEEEQEGMKPMSQWLEREGADAAAGREQEMVPLMEAGPREAGSLKVEIRAADGEDSSVWERPSSADERDPAGAGSSSKEGRGRQQEEQSEAPRPSSKAAGPSREQEPPVPRPEPDRTSEQGLRREYDQDPVREPRIPPVNEEEVALMRDGLEMMREGREIMREVRQSSCLDPDCFCLVQNELVGIRGRSLPSIAVTPP